MLKFFCVLIGLTMLATASIGCKAQGSVDTTAAPHTLPVT